MMLTMLDTKKRLVREAGLSGKIRVGKIAPFFSQESGQLLVEVASHDPKSGKNYITYA